MSKEMTDISLIYDIDKQITIFTEVIKSSIVFAPYIIRTGRRLPPLWINVDSKRAIWEKNANQIPKSNEAF